MAGDWFDLVPGSPFFRPAWRWELATWLVQTGDTVPRRYRDAWVAQARRFLAAGRPRRGHAALAAAARIFEGGAWDRHRLEGYLLTGAAAGVVAERCGLTRTVVDAYALGFCDVRPRLHARDWIVRTLVGHGPWSCFRPDDLARYCKWTALNGGLAALDATLAVAAGDGLIPGGLAAPRLRLPPVAPADRAAARRALLAAQVPASTPAHRLADLAALARPGEPPPPPTVAAVVAAAVWAALAGPGVATAATPPAAPRGAAA